MPRVDANAGFMRQMRLETVRERLVNEGIPVGEKEDLLRLPRAEEQVDQRHRRACLTRARRHDEQRASFAFGECFRDPANGFVLIRPLDDGGIDRRSLQGKTLLANEAQTPQIVRRKEAGDHAWIGDSNIPEKGCSDRWIGSQTAGKPAVAQFR